MSILRRQRTTSKAQGFALVITLLMVALAAIIVIAFLSNASISRTTSTSYHYRYEAEIAAQNGLEAAKKALIASPTAATSLTKDDTFLVVRVDAPSVPITPAAPVTTASYYYLAKAQAGSANKIDYYPLFAGGSSTIGLAINLAANAAPPAVTRPTPPPNPNPSSAGAAAIDTDSGKTKILKAYPAVSSWLGPPSTQWIEIHDPNDTATAAPYTLPYQRYTFWVEDLAGYLDASQVGNENGGSGKHQRASGINPNEIALFTVFDQAQPNDSGNTLAKNLIDNRALLFTVPTLQQAAPAASGQTDLTQPNLAARLGIDTGGEQNLVPFGYGYPTTVEGKAKTNLNNLITAKNISGIATAIDAALPNFKNRAGGNTFDYDKNLAANMIDYADANNAPTTDGSTYRGIGAFPFLVSAYDLNNWVAVTGGPPSDYQVQIEVTTYLQLWNPHNVTAKGDLTLHYENVDQLLVNTNSVSYTPPPDDVLPGFQMQPNDYKVIVFPVKTYTYDWGPTPPATAGPTPSQSSIPFPVQTTANTVRLFWNGSTKLADRPNKNLQRDRAPTGMRYNPNRNATNAVWRGNAAPPIYPATGGVGDPRISYYVNRTWTPADYTVNSCWGGRLQLGRPTVFAEVMPSTWPDGGHNSTPGTKATGASVKPDALAAMTVLTPADANMWVSRLSTKGSLDTLAELGNVFDLGEWNYAVPSTNSSTSLPDIPTSATADLTLGSGGGYTLCIGRPEFSKFDSNGQNLAATSQRAWQLLDIFGLGVRTSTTGVVNLNTASSEALRALAAGVILSRDATVKDATGAVIAPLYGPKSSNTAQEADLFAQAVVNSRPLLSVAQLNTVANSNGPSFGNPNQWKNETETSTSSAQPTEWNDSGREELFSKLLNLTTVRTRNFRVFVTGQALDKNGNVLSTVNKVFQVFLRPTRNTTTGAITSQQVEIRYEAAL